MGSMTVSSHTEGPGVNLLVKRGVTNARANWGRWVADCPSPFCLSALQLTRDQAWFTCRECEAVGEIVWPSMVDDIEQLLMMRPDETTRNWEPGETLHDLFEQNLEHGVLPWDPYSLTTDATFTLAKDRIVTGRAQLTGGR